MTTFKGTKLTHTSGSKSAKIGSKAKKGDKYKNTSKGHNYTCTSPTKASSSATWRYDSTSIVKAPTGKVSSLKLARRSGGARVLDAGWKVPDSLAAATSGARAAYLVHDFVVRTNYDTMYTKGEWKGTGATSASLNLNSMELWSAGSAWTKYTRSDFYPHTIEKIKSVTARVQTYNSKGYGPTVEQKVDFSAPRAPSVSLSFDSSNGRVSWTIATDAGNDLRERYDTEYDVYVNDKVSGKKWTEAHGASTSTGISGSYDAANFQSVKGTHIHVRVKARSRGIAGASAWVERHYYISAPKAPALSAPVASGAPSTGRTTVPVKLNATTEHPVDGVKLQRLVNVRYASASAIPAGAQWEDAGASDNGSCSSLTVASAGLVPQTRGRYTWLRAKAWHGGEVDALSTYSTPVAAPFHEKAPTAADDECAILSGTPSADGTSVYVLVAWDGVGVGDRDDCTSTELSWSSDQEAWESTDAPDSHEFEWADAASARPAQWYKTAKVKVKGLDPATDYWFRARRNMDYDDDPEMGTVHEKGVWCIRQRYRTQSVADPDAETGSEEDEAQPASCVLSAPASVAKGSGVPFTWTVGAGEAQERWELVCGSTVAMSGQGSSGACTMPWERVAQLASGGVLTCRARAYVGGSFAESANVQVDIADPPELSLSAQDAGAQPFSFTAAATTQGCELAWSVLADGGCGPWLPDGGAGQADGDVLATDAGTPEWTAVDDGDGNVVYTATVTCPHMELVDSASYKVTAHATDPATGLGSGDAEARFSVQWSHQAPVPNMGIEPVAEVLEDQDGRVTRRCTIGLMAPEGAGESDVYDVYRVTHDGANLVVSGAGTGATVIDDYAPFGDAGDYGYRIACRTADGDVEWADYGYYLDGGCLRFDWGDGEWAELPYNIGISDSFEKDAEVRVHLDGSAEGYWNAGHRRKASLSTDVMRVEDAETVAAVRAMAQHAGAVFVRTPDGSAYAADVQVSDLSTEGVVLSIAIDAEEVARPSGFAEPRLEAEDEGAGE